MLDIIITICAIYGATYFIKESDILSRPRNWLMQKSVLLTQMLYCWFCTGMHAGWIIYLLHERPYCISSFILWTFAGGAISSLFNAIFNKLTWVKES